jgi:predicted RNase H-like nuclease (RuvC/YqgF family)
VRRRNLEADNPVGHDSFLDVVANIVGILIILVIVAGLRARNAPVKAASIKEDLQPLATALAQDDATQQQLYGDCMRAAQQMEIVQREAAARQTERNRLLTLITALEHDLKQRRGELDAGSQDTFDLERRLAEARRQSEQLATQAQQAADAPTETTVVESYPTPLSKPVDDNEVHFQLRGGRIVYIPVDALVDELRGDARRRAHKLIDMPETTETVGPVDGFRMRYTLVRRDVPVAEQTRTGVATYVQVKEWSVIPLSSQLGESVEEALAEGSAFRQVLAKHHPAKSSITIWTYPSSFEDFRRIRKELYHLGYAVAGRPLLEDMLISGSPDGTKSAAE